jgi:hypothetical protein
MTNVLYVAEVSPDLEDVHGTRIGTEDSNNIRLFTGLSLLYPDVVDLYGFFGLYSGIQLATMEGVALNAGGPEVSNKVPDSGDIVHPVYRVSFDITDEDGINEDSIVVRINDNVAWQNNLQQPGFTVEKTVIDDGFHFDIDSNEQYPYESVIPVRVQASDLYQEPETSDIQWTFSTGSRGPYAYYQFPLPNTGEPGTSSIVIDLKAKYSLWKESIKIWIKPSEDDPYELAFNYSAYPRFTENYNGAESKMEPTSNGLKITIDRIEDYEIGKTISVIVHSSEIV